MNEANRMILLIKYKSIMQHTTRLSYLVRLSWEIQRKKKSLRSKDLTSAWAIAAGLLMAAAWGYCRWCFNGKTINGSMVFFYNINIPIRVIKIIKIYGINHSSKVRLAPKKYAAMNFRHKHKLLTQIPSFIPFLIAQIRCKPGEAP